MVTVLTAQHHVLANGSDDDITLLSHLQCLLPVGFLTGIHLTVQEFVLPRRASPASPYFVSISSVQSQPREYIRLTPSGFCFVIPSSSFTICGLS